MIIVNVKTIIFSSLFLFLTCSIIYAQSADLKARSAFMQAEEYYSIGDYNSSIIKLQRVIKILGKTNPRVQSMLVKSYFGNGMYTEAQKSLSDYFNIANENDQAYNEMIYYIDKVDDGVNGKIEDAKPDRIYYTRELFFDSIPKGYMERTEKNLWIRYKRSIKGSFDKKMLPDIIKILDKAGSKFNNNKIKTHRKRWAPDSLAESKDFIKYIGTRKVINNSFMDYKTGLFYGIYVMRKEIIIVSTHTGFNRESSSGYEYFNLEEYNYDAKELFKENPSSELEDALYRVLIKNYVEMNDCLDSMEKTLLNFTLID